MSIGRVDYAAGVAASLSRWTHVWSVAYFPAVRAGLRFPAERVAALGRLSVSYPVWYYGALKKNLDGFGGSHPPGTEDVKVRVVIFESCRDVVRRFILGNVEHDAGHCARRGGDVTRQFEGLVLNADKFDRGEENRSILGRGTNDEVVRDGLCAHLLTAYVRNSCGCVDRICDGNTAGGFQI